MRIVAVRTVQGAFGNAVMRGQRELSLDVSVALIAQLRLGLHQLAVMKPAILLGKPGHVEEIALRGANGFGLRVAAGFDQVHRVTAIAGNSVLNVAGMAEIFLVAAALMTHQATLGILFGISVERED